MLLTAVTEATAAAAAATATNSTHGYEGALFFSSQPSQDSREHTTASIGIHIAALVVGNIALPLVGALIFSRRNYQPLKSRSPIVSGLLLLMLFYYHNVAMLRVIIGPDKFPCFFYITTYFLCVPAYAIPFILHVYRFFFIFQVSKMQRAIRKLRMRRFSPQHRERDRDDSPVPRVRSSIDSADLQKQQKRQELQMKILVTITSDKFLLLLYGIAMFISIVVYGLFVAFYKPVQSVSGCSLETPTRIIIAAQVIFLGIILFVGAILVLRIRDGLYIGVELIFFFIHSVVTAAVAILSNLIPAYNTYVEYNGLSAALLLSILFFISVFVTLLLPTIISFVWQYRQKKKKKKQQQQSMLQNDKTNNNNNAKEQDASADEDDHHNQFMAALLDVLHEDIHTRKNDNRLLGHPDSPSKNRRSLSHPSSPSSVAAPSAMVGLKRKFRSFCEKEFAQESLLCWDDIEKYKSISALEQRIQMAKEIQKTYIDAKAPLPLNIDSNLARHVVDNIDKGDVHLFDGIQKHLELVMFDTFFRFMQTRQYKEALENRALQMKLLESSGVV